MSRDSGENRTSRYRRRLRYRITAARYSLLRLQRQYRKPAVTVVLLLVGYVAVYTLSAPVASLVPLTVVILVGTDYTVLDKIGLESVRDGIEASDTTLEQVERNLGAKELLHRNEHTEATDQDGPDVDRGLELEHHGGRHFRGTVDDGYNLTPPIRFRLFLDRSAYLLVAGKCRMTKVREKHDGGQVLFFVLTEWEMSSNGDDERQALIELREGVRSGTVDQSVYARPTQTPELSKLDLEEWRTVHELYDRIAEYRE